MTYDRLSEMIGPQLDEVLTAVSNPAALMIEIPDPGMVDLTAGDLSSLVARTSNNYGRLARFAGLARAQAKLAKGRYDRRFKLGRVGNNEAEREAAGLTGAQTEHEALALAEAVAEIAEALESGARVASESARRLLGAVLAQHTATNREEAGVLHTNDFRPY